MENQNTETNKPYLILVVLLMLVLPVLSIIIELICRNEYSSFLNIAGKWFVFWAIGVRLLTAGFRQVSNPAFTGETIFHMKNKESFVVIKELGFSNICFGATAIISLFVPTWRIAAAFAGGLYIRLLAKLK
jgi:hypothetical protein